MDLQLNGKHVLVTGGSKGIGFACARLFLEEGARVTLVSRGAGHLEAAARAIAQGAAGGASRVHAYVADLVDATAALRMVEDVERDWGVIDILVNSAGAARQAPVAQLDAAAWNAAMQAKYFSTLNVLDPVAKRMGERGAGAIVNIVGVGGKVPMPAHLAGGAANAALMLVSSGMASVYGPLGVRINALNPGRVMTEKSLRTRSAEAQQLGVSVEEVLRRVAQSVPLRRLCAPEEVAAAAVFLASPRASYISGAVLAVDGAMNPCVV